MRGQIFSLDVLLAVLLITVIIGFTAIQFERIYSNSNDLTYLELKTLADDWSQIAARNILNSDINRTILDTTQLSDLEDQMNEVMIYDYEVELSTGEKIGGDCSLKENIAISTRPVYINSPDTLGI